MCRMKFCLCFFFVVISIKVIGQKSIIQKGHNKQLVDSSQSLVLSTRKPVTERELTGFDLSTNKVNLAHKLWPQINGKGSTISLKEELMDTADIDFTGRYLKAPSASKVLQTHATTMTTIAAGAGNSYYTGKGVAWGANISSSDFNNLMPDNLLELQQLKVAVQNHSYGVGIENYYGLDAAAYDQQLSQDSSLLHVFSAGNLGDKASSTGKYQGITGFANLTGSFKMAKNNLTVGATDSFYRVISISSRGPAYDGRIKPEIVALGEDGSSGAAAIVSGICLLIRDAFLLYHPSKKPPSSAMIKAILLNSADDVDQPGVDFKTGFGSANAWRAIKTIQDGQVIQGQVTTNQTVQHQITIPSNATNLKLTICWIDPPAVANNSKALINNLDLEMLHSSNTSTKILPWVLNSSPDAVSLQANAIRGIDSLNNVEQISIEAPLSGNYQINVIGKNLMSNQAYSIAWQYDLATDIVFTYPVKGNQVFPTKNNIVRWETALSGPATLQYQINNGSWINIANNVNLSQKYYSWFAPDSIGLVQLRMLVGQTIHHSDTLAIAPIISLKTGFNCTDSFLLYWPSLPVKNYQVYRLGPQYLEPLLVTADSSVVFQKWNTTNQIFTVAPILPQNIKGLTGYALDYTKQQIACYVKGFIADPSGLNSAQLNLELGTTYLVKKIVFEKKSATGYSTVFTLNSVTTQNISAIVPATKGLNLYRAKIELENGSIIYSNLEQVLIFDGNPFYVFPNPAPSGSLIKLMSENIDDLSFMLTDLMGKNLLKQKISSYLEYIQLPLIPQGVYYVSMLQSGVLIKTFPIVVVK
jgi:hypothetical protein